MRMRFGSCIWVIASALLVAACGGTDDAKRGVAEFRSRATQKSYGEIYRTAGAELRQGTTEEQFQRFMTTLDRRLGAWQSAAALFISGAGTAAVLALGVVLAANGSLSLGSLLAFYALLAQLYNPIVRLTQFQSVAAGEQSRERVHGMISLVIGH